MAIADPDLVALRNAFGDDVAQHGDVELRLFVIPVIALPDGCVPARAMAIYVAGTFQGYSSRLFFDVPITLASGFCPGTTTAVLLGRTMLAASIQDVPANLPPHQAILAHLRRYRLPQ